MIDISDVLYCIPLLVVLIALLALWYVLHHTHNLTDYLCVYDGKKEYVIISQRMTFDKTKVNSIRKEYKHKPIREEIKAYGKAFEEDFDKLFGMLKPDVHYRVVTHYANVIEKAEAEGKIKLLSPPKVMEKRTLKELRPLLGLRDYWRIRHCIKRKPFTIRCCDNCKRSEKCKCKLGGVCNTASIKWFMQYDFEIVK